MKFRKPNLPPPPKSTQSEEVQYASMMAAAINQGLPGDSAARLVNTIDKDQVKHAATLTVHELVDWFKRDPAARQILDQVPSFPQFVADFHRAAREMYPPQVLPDAG